MLRNYFKITLRNLVRNKVYSFINIAGLAVGMTCFILIALFIQYEMSYDTQHEKAKQIYRVAQRQKGNEFRGTDLFAKTPAAMAPTLEAEFPEVEVATTVQVHKALLGKEGRVFSEQGLFTDEHVFDVFTFPVVEGAGKEALRDPNTILLTHSLAKKYFANENPLGKTLSLQNERPLTVRGIIADIPQNQHFTFNYITSYKNYPYYEGNRNTWNTNNYHTYMVLQNGSDYQEFEKKLASLDKYLTSYKGLPFTPSFFLQPLLSIHLYSHLNFEMGANGDIRYVYIFASIAFVILLLASINYTNLTTAQSARRAKEVGMRKVVGAERSQLVYQFLGESMLLTLISFVLALGLAKLLLPAFNGLLGQTISFQAIGTPWILVAMLIAALLISGLSGVYPAVFLSALAPIHALKGGFMKSYKQGISMRNMLVVGQFAASIVLAIGSVVIYQQLDYIQHKELGYSRDQIVYVPYWDVDIIQKIPTIRSELLRNPQIEKVSFPVYMPLNMISETIVKEWEGNDRQGDFFVYNNYIDYDFIDLFEIKLKEGRNFSPDYPTDSVESYILNESAVKALGWESAVGKQFRDGKVIGVVKDFHFQPLGLAIKPLFLALRQGRGAMNTEHIAIKVKTGDLDNTLAAIQQTIKNFVPHIPFEYRFMDEAYAQLYQSEQRLGLAFNIFTGLALFIACIGLLGLVSQQVMQRTKEIGIRKVLGASVAGIMFLLSKDFLKLVFLALIIAVPLAGYAMSRWLEDFAYRIDLAWWIFALAGIVALAIALVTISFQALKAALANPVKSLRNE
jgi:putative ABC transport system permease protein